MEGNPNGIRRLHLANRRDSLAELAHHSSEVPVSATKRGGSVSNSAICGRIRRAVWRRPAAALMVVDAPDGRIDTISWQRGSCSNPAGVESRFFPIIGSDTRREGVHEEALWD